MDLHKCTKCTLLCAKFLVNATDKSFSVMSFLVNIMLSSENCIIHCGCVVACATQNTTSSLPIKLQQHNKKPTDCERSATASSSVVPVISKGVSSSAPKLICSEVRSKQVRTSSAASAKWCGDRRPVRQCSAEEIERKKQEALKRRRALALKM